MASLLETIASAIGSFGYQIDLFLLHFQYYYLSKSHVPFDTQFVYDEVFELIRPSMNRYANSEECNDAIERMSVSIEVMPVHVEPEPVKSPLVLAASETEHETETSEDSSGNEESGEEEEEWDKRHDRRTVAQSKEDAEFANMFEKILVESYEQQKYEPKRIHNLLDAETMVLKASRDAETRGVRFADDEFKRGDRKHEGEIRLKMLTRKPKGVATKTLTIPSESSLARTQVVDEAASKKEKDFLRESVIAEIRRESSETFSPSYMRFGSSASRRF